MSKTSTGSSILGDIKISFTISRERCLGQHCPKVVRGLLEAANPQDTFSGGIPYPTAEKIGSKANTAFCNQVSLLIGNSIF